MRVSEVADLVDDNWRYSWHWENDEGYLTEQGIQTALEDAKHQQAYYTQKLSRIMRAVELLKAAGAKEE